MPLASPRLALLGPCILLVASTVALAQGEKPAAVPEALNFANVLLRERRYDLAADQYEKFIATKPPAAQEADARYGLANARLFLGQYSQARQQFQQFLNVAPEHANAPTAWFRVGETSYMLGDLPAARQALEKYTGENPKHRHLETALPYLGDVCLRLGDLPRARKAYEEAVALNPKGNLLDRSRYGLARTLAAQKEPEAALKIFTDLAEHGGAEWSDKARFQVGLVHAMTDQHEQAADSFARLEKDSPRSAMIPEARLRRAESLVKLGRHDDAEALLAPLAASDGALAPQAAYALGNSEAKRDRTAEALATWEGALTRFPASSVAPALRFRTAEVLNDAKKGPEARARFLQIVKETPKHPWADLALLRAAESAMADRDVATAKRLALELPRSYPASALLAEDHLLQARIALAEKDAKEAIAIVEALLAEDKPTDAVASAARYALALAYRQDGQQDKAKALLGEIAAEADRGAGGEGSGDAQFLLGEGHFKAGRHADAVGPLEAYLKAKDRGQFADHALALLAISQQELNQPEAARATLDRLTAEFPESKVLASPRLRLAEAALDAKDLPRAVELFRLAAGTKDEPAVRVRALSGLGWALLDDKKPAEAAEAFRELLASAPDDPLAPDAALAMGRALEDSGKDAEALTAYDLLRTGYPKSDRAAPGRLAHARLLARTGKHAEAAAEIDAILKDHPKGVSEEDGADTLLAEEGWALLDADAPDRADVVFRRLLDEHPESPRAADARVNLAESAYGAGKPDDAWRLLEPIVADGAKADPSLVQSALFRAGRIRFDAGNWAEAARLFDRLAAEFPDGPLRPKARFWKAETAFQSGDAKTAEADFAALVAGPKPADADDWWPTARLRHLQSLVLLERWDDTLREADTLKADLPTFPQMSEVDYARGRAFQGRARFDDARAAYQAVIDARKGAELAARAQLMRGETFFHQKDYTEALKEFFKVDLYYAAPKWQSTALLEAGKVYEQLGKGDKAAGVYEDMIKRFPSEPATAEATRRLDPIRAKSTASAPGEPAR